MQENPRELQQLLAVLYIMLYIYIFIQTLNMKSLSLVYAKIRFREVRRNVIGAAGDDN